MDQTQVTFIYYPTIKADTASTVSPQDSTVHDCRGAGFAKAPATLADNDIGDIKMSNQGGTPSSSRPHV